jgi:hypothetical protein
LAAIDVITAHCESYWLPASLTMRTALDDFGGILGLLLHGSILSNNGATTKPGAVQAVERAINVRSMGDQRRGAEGACANARENQRCHTINDPVRHLAQQRMWQMRRHEVQRLHRAQGQDVLGDGMRLSRARKTAGTVAARA